MSTILQRTIRLKKQGWKERWANRLADPVYNGLLTTATIVYTLVLFLVESNENIFIRGVKEIVELPALILSVLFLLDLIANFVVLGLKGVLRKRKELLLELCLQIAYWTLFLVDIFLLTDETKPAARFTRINAIF